MLNIVTLQVLNLTAHQYSSFFSCYLLFQKYRLGKQSAKELTEQSKDGDGCVPMKGNPKLGSVQIWSGWKMSGRMDDDVVVWLKKGIPVSLRWWLAAKESASGGRSDVSGESWDRSVEEMWLEDGRRKGNPFTSRWLESMGTWLRNMNKVGAPAFRGQEVKEALRAQMEVQRRLFEQVEVQRHVQIRMDAYQKYIDTLLVRAYKIASEQVASNSFPVTEHELPDRPVRAICAPSDILSPAVLHQLSMNSINMPSSSCKTLPHSTIESLFFYQKPSELKNKPC
ncbi:hypothetical protein ZIOFF_005935 [Zingiber officinale]|uniref:MYB-CC type transcription factor LHEQLE-containing domain-containing protein n=1 Tax=Zingiber officinale TaxID=94328 RepID=A0A8J5HUX1_ZINOF|nr:hypothetical protein ZIOFF_005935 [Zingiber officinale]